jgi:hypothetical protein
MRFRLALAGFAVALAACGDDITLMSTRDMTALPDLRTGRDMPPPPDLPLIVPPDLRMLPDLTELPDLVTPPDLATQPDLAMADLATESDFAVAADLAVGDLATPPDLTVIDLAKPDLGGCSVDNDCRGDAGMTRLCCNAACVEGASDPGNCGACGHACAAPSGGAAGCLLGACAGLCANGLTVCGAGADGGGTCKSLQTDVANCGSCGHVCAAPAGGSAACAKGVCAGSCGNGQSVCGAGPDGGGTCKSLQTDVANCGTCGHACPAIANGTSGCSGGMCGLASCDPNFCAQNGACVPFVPNDPLNCGGCGMVCAPVVHGSPGCSGVTCDIASCDPGYCLAGNACVLRSMSDANNCGACGHVCGAPMGGGMATCVGDVCTGSCGNGQTVCGAGPDGGGTCRSLQTDVANCGACGHVCVAPTGGTVTCVNGACTGSCGNGKTVCNGNVDGGGACVDLASDPANCGACGNVCGTGLCGAMLSASFATQPAGWKFNGFATYDGNTQSGVLTAANVDNQAGTILYGDPIVAGDFDVQFDFRIGGGTRADGMGFLIESTSPTAVGNSGGGLGMSGLTGFGVEFDVFNNMNCSDQGGNGNHSGVDSLTVCDQNVGTPTALAESPDLFGQVGDIADGNFRTAIIHVASGKVTLTINGKVILSNITLPAFNPSQPYFFGFSGGTGGLAERQEIQNVSIAFPTARCL